MCVFDYKVKVNKCPGGKKNFGGKNQKNKKSFFPKKCGQHPSFSGGALAAATAWFDLLFPRPQKKRSIYEPPFNTHSKIIL
jgi:hypothetical protein